MNPIIEEKIEEFNEQFSPAMDAEMYVVFALLKTSLITFIRIALLEVYKKGREAGKTEKRARCEECDHERCPKCSFCHNLECGDCIRPFIKCWKLLDEARNPKGI